MPDTTPPVISFIAYGVGFSSATITWITDELADTQINYGTTTAMSLSSTLNTDLALSHQTTLSGLSNGATYYFRVRSRDAAGNLAQSGGTPQFVTLSHPAGTNHPPTVSMMITQSTPYVLGSTLTLFATASDLDGSVASVRFYQGGAQIGIKTAEPYALDYSPPFSGSYVFTAIALDDQGQPSASAIIQITVQRPLPAPVLRLPRFIKPGDLIKVDYPEGYNIHHFEWRLRRLNIAAPSTAPSAVSAAKAINTTQASIDLSPLDLDAGDYEISLRAVDKIGVASPEASAVITLAPGTFDSVKIHPNPWRMDKHAGQPITFTNMPLTATVKIFTTSGQWVKTLTAVNGSAAWDLKDDSGDFAASGLYFYLALNDQNKPTKGKFVIIR